jgi:hypothetical protein
MQQKPESCGFCRAGVSEALKLFDTSVLARVRQQSKILFRIQPLHNLD